MDKFETGTTKIVSIGSPKTDSAIKFLILGSGELGKEMAMEAQGLGIEVVAVDRYREAPAMQVAHKNYVISMLDGEALRNIIEIEKPDYIIPEIEAIATHTLLELEKEGHRVVPNATAVSLTMNRERIRRLAKEQLNLMTTPYRFATNLNEYHEAIQQIGLPCVVKPIMSSSGKGQSILRDPKEIEKAWQIAKTKGRSGESHVIVEAFIPFDYEITLLTVRHVNGTLFCPPIGHLQVQGDYRESWQPHPMSKLLLEKAESMAKTITDALGGYGLFGVEFFVKGDEIYFSEVSPRPHDTGFVTLVSQDLSQFALHIRAILGLPIPHLRYYGCAASHALLAKGEGKQICFHHLEKLATPETYLRLFGKPEVKGERRMGVILTRAENIDAAREKARALHASIKVTVA